MTRKQWIVAVILFGIVYFVVGILFGELAKQADSATAQFRWRLAAWVVSGAVYAGHIGYERFGMHNRPHPAALHVALAAALGAFLLATAAAVHALMVTVHASYLLHLIALVLWPLLAGVPAFVVAWIVGMVLALFSPSARPSH